MSIFICPSCGDTATISRVCTKGCDMGLVSITKVVPKQRDDESEEAFSTRKAHMESLRIDASHDVGEHESPLVKFARVWS